MSLFSKKSTPARKRMRYKSLRICIHVRFSSKLTQVGLRQRQVRRNSRIEEVVSKIHVHFTIQQNVDKFELAGFPSNNQQYELQATVLLPISSYFHIKSGISPLNKLKERMKVSEYSHRSKRSVRYLHLCHLTMAPQCKDDTHQVPRVWRNPVELVLPTGYRKE